MFVLINVSNKDCAASVIHEGLDPILDMSRSIDSSIFVMRHAPLYTTDFLKHIGLTLHRRYVACERNGMRRNCEPNVVSQLGAQRAPHDPRPRSSCPDVSAVVQPAPNRPTPSALMRHHRVIAMSISLSLVYPCCPVESTNRWEPILMADEF